MLGVEHNPIVSAKFQRVEKFWLGDIMQLLSTIDFFSAPGINLECSKLFPLPEADVWLNVPSSASRAHSEDRIRHYGDLRVTNLWDGNPLTGWFWKDHLDLAYFAWDAYFLCDVKADWHT